MGVAAFVWVTSHLADTSLWMGETRSHQPQYLKPMSEEQLKALLEAVKADAGLQEKLSAAKDADAVVEIAKAAGFVISADELNSKAEISREISEEELEGVAGGTQFGTRNSYCTRC